MAHARRKFDEAKDNDLARASYVLTEMQKLYYHENSGGLKAIYDSLHNFLKSKFNPVRKQNVSFRINLNGLEVDITPARKHSGNTNDHWLHVSKLNTWRQTNIQKHITDISTSGRTSEIKVLKIWRELNSLDFPSIYLEYLTLNILSGKSKDATSLADNVWHVINELKRDIGNPLFGRIFDPANTGNILSDLLTTTEKNAIIPGLPRILYAKFENVFLFPFTNSYST